MAKNKGGRPRIEIDWVQFDKLCSIQATEEEIADWFNCTVDTIDNHCKREYKIGFSEYYKKNSCKGKISLRRKQVEVALSGNVSMLIWLGKNILKQKDTETDTSSKGEAKTIDEIAREYNEAKAKYGNSSP